MKNLRRWELTPESPYSLYLAADMRLCQTNYTDDQIWKVLIGRGDNAALALHTKYGGRAGLASLVPLWVHDGRVIYQAQTYHQAPVITAFAPNYIEAEAYILPGVMLKVQHLAFNSCAIGGMYTLQNNGDRDVRIRFELFGHVGRRGQEEKLAIVTLAQGGHALSLGNLGRLMPVVMIENGQASSLSSQAATPKVGVDLHIPAGHSVSARFVHAGLHDIRLSLVEARRWLALDWKSFLDSIDQAASAVPVIQTGDLDVDLVLASSYNRLVQAFLRPAGVFPRETFVAGRAPEYGYSKRGDGGDHPRMWEGQSPDMAYLLTPVMAGIHAAAAEGVIRNFVAMQKSSGFIDLKPGPASQRQDLLCTPVLARATWHVYQRTENVQFIKDIFPALKKFFAYWLTRDTDGDGVPEWQHERQTHYLAFPTFGRGRVWAQGADITTAETPDLLAYLISEADALKNMANVLGDKDAVKELNGQIKGLSTALKTFWNGAYFAYRDRDTNITTSGMVLLEDGAGDVEHVVNRALAAPNRIIVSILGGVSHVPNISLHINGLDREGNQITETAAAGQMLWQNRMGLYTSQQIFSKVDMIRCDGLIRVYRISARAMDTTSLDANALMPLLSGAVSASQAEKLVQLGLDKKHFLRPNGITMASASDSLFDPTSADGAGGLWLYWQTLLGEGILEAGEGDKVADIVKGIFKMLQQILAKEHQFAQFYHSDEPVGLGEKDHVGGIAPLYLFERLVGVRVISCKRVWLSQNFAWNRAITIHQHGVYIRRTNKRIKVEFPSGTVIEPDIPLKSDIFIDDPQPQEPGAYGLIELPEEIRRKIPEPQPTTSQGRSKVIIEVEHEE